MESIKKRKQLDREVSWMYFNGRLLQEAADNKVPLIERLRFLGIYSNNLDEFYRVRVAGLKRLVRLGSAVDHFYDEAQKTLGKIKKLNLSQQNKFEILYHKILTDLEDENIDLIDEKGLNDQQKEFIFNFYKDSFADSLYPIIINNKSKFPELTDGAIYLFVSLNHNFKNFGLIEVPVQDFSRFVILPEVDGKKKIMLLEDVIRFCLPLIFRSISFEESGAYLVKITRDAAMELEHEVSETLTDKILKGLKNRKKGIPVRLLYDRELPEHMKKFLMMKLGFQSHDSCISGGRYHNFRDFMGFPNLNRSDLVHDKWPPSPSVELDKVDNLLDYVLNKDIGLHYPYQNFSYFIRLLREASIDPKVKSIKITLYRLAGHSKIVQALINAARNGKKVTAVIELFARFDESANIDWSKRMQDAGIEVLYGKQGVKIHAKLTYIERKGGSIACISTGNFHEGNAKLYTDFSIMTTAPLITREVNRVFHLISKQGKISKFKHLLVSPYNMRSSLFSLFDSEIKKAKQGKEAYVYCKINHICDKHLIDKIYEADEAGVNIYLLVRGNCSIFTKKTKNIQVRGIIDRYLEHSRMFIFANGGEELFYISSADWMTRNIDHRIEVAVPILCPEIKEHIRTIIQYGLKDNVKARIVDGSGDNRFYKSEDRYFRSQEELYNLYNK